MNSEIWGGVYKSHAPVIILKMQDTTWFKAPNLLGHINYYCHCKLLDFIEVVCMRLRICLQNLN